MKQLDTVGQYAISQNRRPVPQLSEVRVKHLVAAETPEVLGFLAQRPLHTVMMAGFTRNNGRIPEKYRQSRPQSSKLPVNRPASWLRRLN